MLLPFDQTCCLDKPGSETYRHYLVSGNSSQKRQSEWFFLVPLPPIVQVDAVHQLLCLPHKRHTNFCKQHVTNLRFLVSLESWDSSGSFSLWESSPPMVLHLGHFPFRHLHEALQLVPCHHQLVQHHDSNFSLDLRAHCAALLVSRLLRVVRKIVGFCGFHLSAQVEVENVIFEIYRNKLFSSMPVQPFFDMSSHTLTNFAVNRNHVTTIMSQIEILSSFARDLCSTAQYFMHSNKSSVEGSKQSVFIAILKWPRSTSL